MEKIKNFKFFSFLVRGFWIWCLLYSIEENGKGQWKNGIWFGNTSKRCRRLHSDRTWGIYTGNGSNIILSSDQTEAALSRGAEKHGNGLENRNME